MSNMVLIEKIERRIFLIRGEKVMIDRDLAELYGVSTKRLNEQVKRNPSRFPDDFMFRLTAEEKNELVANCDRFKTMKHATVFPHAFTERGVAMLSSVLNSERAIMVNINIMRVFSRIKQLALNHGELLRKVELLEIKYGEHDQKIAGILQALRQLLEPKPVPPKRRIGFIDQEK